MRVARYIFSSLIFTGTYILQKYLTTEVYFTVLVAIKMP